MRIIEGNNYYTAQEVADTIGVHIQTVRMWIKTKNESRQSGKMFLCKCR